MAAEFLRARAMELFNSMVFTFSLAGIPPRAVMWPSFRLQPIESLRSGTTGFFDGSANARMAFAESLLTVAHCMEMITPMGCPPPAQEMLNGLKRSMNNWTTDMIYGQTLCRNDDAIWHRLTQQQPIMGYPDVTKLAEHWNLTVEACSLAVPDTLAKVHTTWWDIGPTNMLEMCTQGVQLCPMAGVGSSTKSELPALLARTGFDS